MSIECKVLERPSRTFSCCLVHQHFFDVTAWESTCGVAALHHIRSYQALDRCQGAAVKTLQVFCGTYCGKLFCKYSNTWSGLSKFDKMLTKNNMLTYLLSTQTTYIAVTYKNYSCHINLMSRLLDCGHSDNVLVRMQHLEFLEVNRGRIKIRKRHTK